MGKATDETPTTPKPVHWMGSCYKVFKTFPKLVRQTFGQALYDAQTGEKHPAAKPLKGFGGGVVLEVVEECDGKSYRAVDTVRFAGIEYVLHVFQKKSKSGIKTPAEEIDKVRRRLKDAEHDYTERSGKNQG